MRLHYANFILTFFFFFFLTSSTNAGASKNAARRFIVKQNTARAALRLPPLMWDKNLAKYARSYARQRREDCALEHSHGPYGENIFWGSGDEWTPDQAAAAWVAEKRGYNYGSNSCAFGQECGHYTQIVWRDTRKIGCAKIVCNKGKGVFMICSYNPPGNYIGERPY